VLVGEFQNLIVKRESPYGLYLTDDEIEILLPENQCPDDALVGHSLKVFVYTDSEDRIIATRMKPHATVGEFGYMQVVGITGSGAFFDWGLQKDLFCPFREQHINLEEGRFYTVRVYLDEASRRVVCSTRISKFLESDGSAFATGDTVKILVADQTPEFLTVIVNNHYKGAIFRDEWSPNLTLGSKHRAFIKRVRPGDGRLALSLRPQGFEALSGEQGRLLRLMQDNGGRLPLGDHSSPAQIHAITGLSKGAFKKLIGSLYRDGKIVIENTGIRLS
jgi:uncharacterized protein